MPTALALALSSANVTSPSGINYSKVQVAAADGRIALAEQNGVSLGQLDGVVDVQGDSASGGWLVTFDSGEVWTVVRARGCGCGGR